MAKTKTVYACQSCGHQSPKWLGRCPDCSQWNTFSEEPQESPSEATGGAFFELRSETPLPLNEISDVGNGRLTTQAVEFDRVLGGGIVPGSLILIGGDPGIGKSTLILQVLDRLTRQGIGTLYVTGEESREQIKLRASRLGVESAILILAENSVDRMVAQVQKIKPSLLVVDSIQTIYLPALQSAPGSISQVRESAGKLLYLSKTMGIATILIGHVTKDGALAGPRVLEHMVDCVLYFEGDSHQQYRILRTMKNRYGSTNEIGVFEMTQKGLIEVDNPSTLFLSEQRGQKPGSSITASLEGVRPILVELQALVSSSSLANPRRTTLGVEGGRVAILVAVLEKIVGLNLFNQDIYVNAAGGFRVVEPAADLAILASLVSSFNNKPLPPQTLIIGEVGLSGEVRGVNGLEIRLKEAEKLGLKQCIMPKSKGNLISPSKMRLVPVESVAEALEAFF